MEIRLRSVVSEISSAYADLGTFLPLMLGTVLVAGMNPVGILYGFGLFALMTALVYRLPIPVQPMKAVAAMAIAGMAIVVCWQRREGPATLAMGLVQLVLGFCFLLDKQIDSAWE